MKELKKFFSDNGLLLVFAALFLASLAGQAFAGRALFNQVQNTHHLKPVSFEAYLGTGEFLQGMFANWQAAILQLGSLIIFGIFLRQRGAPHSRLNKKPVRRLFGQRRAEERSSEGKHSGDKHTRSQKTKSWIYDNSLSIAFVALFLVVFVLHILSGAAAYNQQLTLNHQPTLSVGEFFASSKFWFSTMQTWEAEYMAIALYLLLSIFLRQKRSPESKPIGASDADTGDANK
jgi:hypothetical protein